MYIYKPHSHQQNLRVNIVSQPTHLYDYCNYISNGLVEVQCILAMIKLKQMEGEVDNDD